MAKLLRLDVAQLTDVGRKRDHNEDNMAYVIPKDPTAMMHKGALFIVADGMGGHAAGEVASEIAVDTISNAYYQDDNDDVPAALLYAIRRANATIQQRAAENTLRNGMGTTCVAAVLRGNVAYIANVGDSRAYLIRKARIRQISLDHSLVAEQVRAGLLTEEQARTHVQRNVITRSLGTQADVEVDIFREFLEEGDTLVLCSDGLSGYISEEDLLHTVEQFVPQESVYHLIERANENGGGDNITAIVAHVEELGVEPPGVRQPVPMGGPEVSEEDTARLFAPIPGSGTNTILRNGEIPVPGSPFPYTSEPLTSSTVASAEESVTAPQAALSRKGRRGRLFYPTLTLVVLFLLAAVGSGAYYFVHASQTQTVSQKLNSASQFINAARNQLTSNPVQALQTLANAQQQLQGLSASSLDPSQDAQLTTLDTQLVSETRVAITNYNAAAKISAVPCPGTTPNSIENGSTGTEATSITLLKNGSSIFYYALGQDGKIYQLSSSAQSYTLAPAFNTSVLNFASTNGELFALTEQTTNGTPSYAIELLTPGTQGMLNTTKTQTIDSTQLPDGDTPTLITAINNDIYVVISSKANPNTITILGYSLSSDGKHTFSTPKATPQISVSAEVTAVAAIPGELFLLLSDGQLLSSQISSDLTLSTPPASVLIDAPIAAPLTVDAASFTATSPVPTAVPTQQQTGNRSFSIPASSNTDPITMSAGPIETSNQAQLFHLFIGDSANHRVLDLIVQLPASSGGPAGSTPTPALTGTAATASTTLSLIQQYVSPTFFTTVKSVAAAPGGSNIYILGQNSQNNANLVTVTSGQQQVCAS